ncbi:MAG TPA: ATP-binding cassette domain-containing protein [Anaerolineales bacterium]|nr:ATP-binding cassette domain-containing protein [Anaerolineales bacterium]
MVELDRVSYWYPDSTAPALTGVDLSLLDGERLLVAGASGAGKSTLLRVMNGLVPHFYGGRFRGRALIGGLDTRQAGPATLARKVGMVFQEPQSRFLTSSIEDEIAFGMESAGAGREEIRLRVADIVGRLELGPLLGRSLDRLSAGEQAKVAIAAALSRHPGLLLMDEPCTELDPPSANAVVRWVEDLQREQAFTLAVSDHRLERWLDRVGRVVILRAPGTLEAAGPPREMRGKLPFGEPVGEAAQALGLPAEADREAVARALAALQRPEHAAVAPIRGERLVARGLSFAYNGLPALKDVDVEVGEGEIVGLVGRNGSGKTTLLRCLMGLITPTTGEIRLDGRSLIGVPVAERARDIGYVPQAPGSLLFSETVADELAFTLSSHGLENQPPVDPSELLERLGLKDVRDAYPRDLSAGQRQRVALAAVLVTSPKLVLLDEPTLGMDPRAQRDLGRLLRDLAEAGTGILVASHDVDFLASHAQRLVVLEAGRLLRMGDPAETLFAFDGFGTSLQELTGRAWPACVEDIVVSSRRK